MVLPAGIVWAVFSPSIEKANPRVTTADIEAVLRRFREMSGREPVAIALNPKLVGTAPDGIVVCSIAGCLSFEVWVSDTVPSGADIGEGEDYESWLNKVKSKAQEGGQ